VRRSASSRARPTATRVPPNTASADRRHAFAWELERAGTPVTVISALLGHSSVAVTARYLNHLTNHQAVSALAAADLPGLGL
jgi:integrase